MDPRATCRVARQRRRCVPASAPGVSCRSPSDERRDSGDWDRREPRRGIPSDARTFSRSSTTLASLPGGLLVSICTSARKCRRVSACCEVPLSAAFWDTGEPRTANARTLAYRPKRIASLRFEDYYVDDYDRTSNGGPVRSTVCILGLIAIGAASAPVSRARPSMSSTSEPIRRRRQQGHLCVSVQRRTGALTPIGLVAETPDPSFLTASANGSSSTPSTSCRIRGGAGRQRDRVRGRCGTRS